VASPISLHRAHTSQYSGAGGGKGCSISTCSPPVCNRPSSVHRPAVPWLSPASAQPHRCCYHLCCCCCCCCCCFCSKGNQPADLLFMPVLCGTHYLQMQLIRALAAHSHLSQRSSCLCLVPPPRCQVAQSEMPRNSRQVPALGARAH